jgi:hypothetical protein
MKRWTSIALRVAGSLLLTLLLLELVSCVYLGNKDLDALRVWEESSSGGVDGISVKKNFEQRWKAPEFSVRVKTNNFGMREDFDHAGERIDVGFYGDSFTFGHGVEAGQRYSDLLRNHLPGKRVVTFGYLDGWTPPHYYLFLKKHPDLAPDLAVVGLFLGNDLTGDMDESKLVTDAQGELTSVVYLARSVDRRGFLVSVDVNPVTRALRKSWFGEVLLRERVPQRLGISPTSPVTAYGHPMEKLDRGELNATSHTCLEYVARMRDLLASRGKRLVVFLIPWSYYVGPYASPHDEATTADIRRDRPLPKAVAAWCATRGIECVDPIARFQELEAKGVRLYFAQDAHWNAEGHRVAAEVLAEHLRAGGDRAAPGR